MIPNINSTLVMPCHPNFFPMYLASGDALETLSTESVIETIFDHFESPQCLAPTRASPMYLPMPGTLDVK